MRFRRASSATLGAMFVAASAALAAPPAHAAPAQTAEYVALGDSYSSGSGAGDYSDAACTRSRNAFPAKWAEANSPGAFTFAACGGATIPTVEADQLSALGPDTSLVSITVGGNDSGFATTMLSCRYFSDRFCQYVIDRGGEFIENELPGELDDLYAAIAERAPQARVVVLGYPYLYATGGSCDAGGISAAERQMLKEGSDGLNEVIAGRAAAAGFAFADARPAFAGHEICTADPWISESNLHPTAEGHADGYLPAMTAAID